MLWPIISDLKSRNVIGRPAMRGDGAGALASARRIGNLRSPHAKRSAKVSGCRFARASGAPVNFRFLKRARAECRV